MGSIRSRLRAAERRVLAAIMRLAALIAERRVAKHLAKTLSKRDESTDSARKR